MKYLDINCDQCGNVFKIQPKRYNYSKKHGRVSFYCSKECRQIHRNKLKKETINCPECNSEFIRLKTWTRKTKFCSQKCANKYTRKHFYDPKVTSIGLKKFYSTEKGKINALKHGEKVRKYKLCPQCNSRFYGHKKYCSKTCMKICSSKKISNTRKEMFQNGELDVTGGNTKWLTYKNIKVQGSYEYRTCIILDILKELNLIKDWHKSNFRIKYIGIDNKEHSYLVDFEIITNSGKILYLEIKGYIKDNDLLKWKAMKNNCYKLIVWMVKHLNQIENKLKI